MAWLGDGIRVPGVERDQVSEGFRMEMGLVPENNCPTRQTGLPARPLGGTLDGTEHAALRLWIEDTVLTRETQPIQFGRDRFVIGPTNHGNLGGIQGLPLADEVTDNGGSVPGQQQFGLPHPRGGPRSENNYAQPGSTIGWARMGHKYFQRL